MRPIATKAAGFLAVALLHGCLFPTDPPRPTPPQTVVLFATPKIIPDFSNPSAAVASFLQHYDPLISRAAETIVIFSVGNSDHILNYQGADFWDTTVDWARLTDGVAVSNQLLDYHEIAGVVQAFRDRASALGINLKVYDQIDSGNEFTLTNNFKYNRHSECMNNQWQSFDVGVPMVADDSLYATAPDGIAAGTLCGVFLANQVAAYLQDLEFDGILYDNQLGTRGRWLPDNGPGYSAQESAAILAFLEHSRSVLGDKGLIWFDSYNNIQIERDTYSFPEEGYAAFDYLLASGFCIISSTPRYSDNLESKLQLKDRVRVLATLDYVDPWYSYESMTEYSQESRALEDIAVHNRYEIDGILFFANDHHGVPVPRQIIESFAKRFWR